ncbi:hypothetical protein [Paenibacillus sp. B2(2019)]|uniref:hypothetical protein n=1 Tax=Paenibacillus sp. B2(2019) TaxID=2607754 RepID=UPI00165F10AC|nr:hypothetical protein [Paenibacillus sp. B2(2019)]
MGEHLNPNVGVFAAVFGRQHSAFAGGEPIEHGIKKRREQPDTQCPQPEYCPKATD